MTVICLMHKKNIVSEKVPNRKKKIPKVSNFFRSNIFLCITANDSLY